jgi:hypothetical protein
MKMDWKKLTKPKVPWFLMLLPALLLGAPLVAAQISSLANRNLERMTFSGGSLVVNSGGGVADDADFSAGTTTGSPVMGVYESSPTSITDGDMGVIGVTVTRALRAVIESITPGTTATSLGKAVDSAVGATDTVVAMGCVRDDATTTLTPADADYTNCRTNARGALWVALDTALAHAIDSVRIFGENGNSIISCNANAFLNMTTATTTEIVALSGSTHVYVCSYSIVSEGDIATTVKFVSGTGSNCATSQQDRSSGLILQASATNGVARGSGMGMILKTGDAGDALCVTSSAAANVGIDISYTQF